MAKPLPLPSAATGAGNVTSSIGWEEEGCFVYRVLFDVNPRNFPSVQDEYRIKRVTFMAGQLVCIDKILYSAWDNNNDNNNAAINTTTEQQQEQADGNNNEQVVDKMGPFLRLADGGGWLFEWKRQKQVLQRVSTIPGLWTFYVDNCPAGIALRRHPIDSQDMKYPNAAEVEVVPSENNNNPNNNNKSISFNLTCFLPMQKIYCDLQIPPMINGKKAIEYPVTFYRVQGTHGWVFDRRESECMLLPAHLVETGLFAFRVMDLSQEGRRIKQQEQQQQQSKDKDKTCQAKKVQDENNQKHDDTVTLIKMEIGGNSEDESKVSDTNDKQEKEEEEEEEPKKKICRKVLAIRCIPHDADKYKTGRTLKSGDFLVADVIRLGSPSPLMSPSEWGRFPFVRLTDGSGWVFCNSPKSRRPVLERVAMKRGQWTFRIENQAGIGLRRQPRDSTETQFTTLYTQKEIIECDYKISDTENGMNFYRVRGTDGWVFDRRQHHEMMVEIKNDDDKKEEDEKSDAAVPGWTVDFIRGVALIANEIQEVECNTEEHLMVFLTKNDVHIKVYYKTQTVVTSSSNAQRGTSRVVRRNCTSQELAEIMRQSRPNFLQVTGRKRQRPNNESQSDASGDNGQSDSNNAVDHQDNEVEEKEEDGEYDLRLSLMDCEEEMNQLRNRKLSLLKSLRGYEHGRAIEAQKMEAKRIAHYAQLEQELLLERQRRTRLAQEAEQILQLELGRTQQHQQQGH